MARTRSYNEAEVLAGAMHAFRRHGYERVSIKQLERATGLTSGSLYNAYGDKDGVFRAAFAHYVDTIIRRRIEAVGGRATLGELEQFFCSVLQPPLADGYGCLVTNSIVEFGSKNSVVSKFIDEGIGLLSAAIQTVLTREIGAQRAELETARLVALYQGILVLTRAGRRDGQLLDVVRDEFDRLRAQSIASQRSK